jgi:hypothetical protein
MVGDDNGVIGIPTQQRGWLQQIWVINTLRSIAGTPYNSQLVGCRTIATVPGSRTFQITPDNVKSQPQKGIKDDRRQNSKSK